MFVIQFPNIFLNATIQLDIVNIIMKRDNYMISLINKDVLRLRLPRPFPQRKFLTKALEWGIRIALFDYILSDSVSNPCELSLSERDAFSELSRLHAYITSFFRRS